MELKGKWIAVLADDSYENVELWDPVLRLREAGPSEQPPKVVPLLELV